MSPRNWIAPNQGCHFLNEVLVIMHACIHTCQVHYPQGVFLATADERVELDAAASVTREAMAKFYTADINIIS